MAHFYAIRALTFWGPFALVLFYRKHNARHYDGFIVSTYFCQIRLNGEEKIFYGDFLIKIKDNFAVEKIYRLCK